MIFGCFYRLNLSLVLKHGFKPDQILIGPVADKLR
jgi:hypothetical protein